MPSTQTRLYADLISIIRDLVNEAEEVGWTAIRNEIWELANKEEREALKNFGGWFNLE